MAIKQIKDVFGVFENAKRIYREITVLRCLDHDNIIKLVHVQMPKCVYLTINAYAEMSLMVSCVPCCDDRNLATFSDLYIVFECMDLDLNKLGRDTKQSIGIDHVRWFMYQVCWTIKSLFLYL